MNDTSPDTSPVEQPTTQVELGQLFVTFLWNGVDNGVPKEGFDSRVLSVPKEVQFKDASDLKSLSDALAGAFYDEGKRFKDLEVVLLNVSRLPI